MKLGESLVNTEEYFKLKTFRDNIPANKIVVHKINYEHEQWITENEAVLILLEAKQSLIDSYVEKSEELNALMLEFKNLQKAFDNNVERKVFKNSMYIAGVFSALLIIIEIIRYF